VLHVVVGLGVGGTGATHHGAHAGYDVLREPGLRFGLRMKQPAREREPDVCLLDMTMHGIDGVETLSRLRKVAPAARVLMLTSSDSAEDMARAMKAGANGYVTKNVQHKELFDAIREVHAGGRPVSSSTIVESRPTTAQTGASPLTPREIEVGALMREGFTNQEIGRLLGISTHTAKAHVAGVLEKLDASDRTQAVARAFDLGLLKAAHLQGRPKT
jgi:two-component system NarL family response regulator